MWRKEDYLYCVLLLYISTTLPGVENSLPVLFSSPHETDGTGRKASFSVFDDVVSVCSGCEHTSERNENEGKKREEREKKKREREREGKAKHPLSPLMSICCVFDSFYSHTPLRRGEEAVYGEGRKAGHAWLKSRRKC